MSPRWCLFLLFAPSLWAQDPSPSSLPIRVPVQAASPEAESGPDVLALADIERLVGAERARLEALSEAQVEHSYPSPIPELPPGDMSVTEGVTLAIPIGLGQINRLRTPFREFRVLHQSTATVRKQGSALYVTPMDALPFAVYLEDKDPPNRTIGLLLRPNVSLPPVQVQLALSGFAAETSAAASGPVEPHVGRLRQVLRSVAQGLTPAGYVERLPRSDDPLASCAIPGLSMQRDHVIEGVELLVLVFRVTNQSAEAMAIDEAACAAPGLLAVATFPDVVVPAGGNTISMQVYRRTVGLSASPLRFSTSTSAGAP